MRLFKPLSIWGVECTLQWNDLKQLSAKQLTKVAAFIYLPNLSKFNIGRHDTPLRLLECKTCLRKEENHKDIMPN
jgi:hypothetical protein